MCGITGFLDFTKRSDEIILTGMTNALQHRGPDEHGKRMIDTASFQLGLGHRRLSIIDLTETGKQPMRFQNTVVTFNGEIYNFAEIKSQLSALGHQFAGHSDTEVLLHAYTQWGISCVQKFIGMFAFVLYDADKELIYCVRDRAGIKPFFYYQHEGLFLFASELKAFHQHPWFKKELNTDAVAAFMQFGNVPSPHCIFHHCYKLPPGHYMECSLRSASVEFSIHKYWDVYDAYNKPKHKIDFEEAKTETEKILRSAADYRMVADVPVGVFLSGGYDSACLTALLQKDRTERLKTYTIAVPDIGLNEAPFAKQVADYLGTDHHEYTCTAQEALDLVDGLPYYYDEPFADSSAIPTSLVCKMARKEVTVALSADAGDEVFAGYNRYDYLMKHGERLKNMPSFLRKAAAGMMGSVNAGSIPYFRNKYNFPNRYEKMKSLLNDPSDRNLMLSLSRQFDEQGLAALFKNKVNLPETRYTNTDLRDEFYSPLSYMMAVDYQTYLVDDILQKVDRASMSVGLEAREPYLDHRLIEWAARLPDEFKYNKGNKKYILKAITHKHIPQAMMERPKMGFAIPIEKWMLHELKEKIDHYLDPSRIEKQQIFNTGKVNELLTKFRNGKKEYGVKIWYLLMFQMWYDKWMP
ncbi:MAG: asparagine synthase (glutamine-hydrolyzing) [Bacteroidetes bacterium]|jgi:asparagine synthase (glutamine-hydrolysing)|nr:asparagine synthase (glutamine-hydrolyzing) [Bacteroidota bacterium]